MASTSSEAETSSRDLGSETGGATGGQNKAETAANKPIYCEYETQHFGFTPISLLNGMFNTVCDLYREALKAFCQKCVEKYPNALSEEELRNARHSVSALIDKDICMMFDALEYFLLHKVFAIPEDVVLPEDRCQLEFQEVKENGHSNSAEERIREVKKQIIKIKYANAVLSRHLEDSQVVHNLLEKVLKQISTSEGSANKGGKDVKDWISYYGELLKILATTKPLPQ